MTITIEMVDAAAKELRQQLQGHKRLNDWSLVPKGQKHKWIALAEKVLLAARAVS